MPEPVTPPERPAITVTAPGRAVNLPPGRYFRDGEGDDRLVRLGDVIEWLRKEAFATAWHEDLRDYFNREA